MQYIGLILTLAGLLFLLEQFRPNTVLPKVSGWHIRAFVFNSLQAVVAYLGTILWDVWFQEISLFKLQELHLVWQVLLGYIVLTFVYYWWHRVRHTSNVLWRYLHQFHHSARRIEVITSFYKSPIELVLNSLISSAILYTILGISAEGVALAVLVTALAELIYHMNLKTPHIMGYFFQRPEMHRIHHESGKHHYNYSDLPLWDMLFGTFSNPKDISVQTGFPDDSETRVWDLLRGKKIKI